VGAGKKHTSLHKHIHFKHDLQCRGGEVRQRLGDLSPASGGAEGNQHRQVASRSSSHYGASHRPSPVTLGVRSRRRRGMGGEGSECISVC